MTGENLPCPSGSDGPGDEERTKHSREPASAGLYDEVTAIRADPRMRGLAQRLVGDLAEDLLQETWYIVAQAAARRPIANPRGYFYVVMVNAAKRMREDIARQGIPVDDPLAAVGSRGAELATGSAEDSALSRLLAGARRELLRRRQAELRRGIPACSPDPERYRDVILAVADAMLAADGPASRPEVNAGLIAAYPEWFARPGATAATRYQRRCRGRADVGRVLAAVIGR